MPAVPKRKVSRTRRANRRSHWTLRAIDLVRCRNCGSPRRPHQVCSNCGMYRGVEVIEIVEAQ